MTEPTQQAYESLQLCRLRATRLDANGKPLAGAESILVTDAAITLGWKVVLKAGAKFDQDSGCGDTKLTFQDDDIITGVDLTADFTALDAELVAMLTGATLVTKAGIVRGWALPTTKLTQRVGIEAWTNAWDYDEPAIDVDGVSVLHHRFIFPSTSWVIGDGTLQNQPFNVPFTGHGRGNTQWGDGPANDLPWGVYTSAMGHYIDEHALPAVTTGFATLVAS